jgi:hypothetical protein
VDKTVPNLDQSPVFPGDNQIPETLGGLTLKEVPVAIDGIAIVVHPEFTDFRFDS